MPVQTQMQVRRGTASSWTSTNPTLAAGELGFETDTGKFKIGNGSSTWTALSYAGGGQNTLTTYQYTATAAQTTFSGVDANGNTLSYTAGAVQVYLNGALLQNTADYAASTGTSVVLTTGATVGDSLTILSLGSFTVSTDIPKSTLTAKGSIVAASAASTPANLSVGANDTVLTADSSTATGLKWATPASGGMTLISSTTLSGTTVTISSIPSTYKNLEIIISDVTCASSNSLTIKPNNISPDSLATIYVTGSTLNGGSASNFGTAAGSNQNGVKNSYVLQIYDYASSRYKMATQTSNFPTFSSGDQRMLAIGSYLTSDVISSLTIISSVTMTAGTCLIYGVS